MSKDPKIVREPKIVRAGSSLKLVDEMPIDVRVAIDEAARLGQASVLDAEATLLEYLAGSKRQQHKARVHLDANPHILPMLPEPRRPWLHFAMVGLSIITLVLVASIASRAAPPRPALPESSVGAHPPSVLQTPKAVASTQKGRAR